MAQSSGPDLAHEQGELFSDYYHDWDGDSHVDGVAVGDNCEEATVETEPYVEDSECD